MRILFAKHLLTRQFEIIRNIFLLKTSLLLHTVSLKPSRKFLLNSRNCSNVIGKEESLASGSYHLEYSPCFRFQFFFGDFNYRIDDLEVDVVKDHVKANELNLLKPYDQVS